MTRQEWEKRSGNLRGLMRQLRRRPLDSYRLVRYRFGAGYLASTGLWYIYNYGSQNIIATVRMIPNNETVIRYRANSVYRDVLSGIQIGERTYHLADDMRPERDRVRQWLHDRIRRNLEARVAVTTSTPVRVRSRFIDGSLIDGALLNPMFASGLWDYSIQQQQQAQRTTPRPVSRVIIRDARGRFVRRADG